jgi:SAM-dependent methyltransferase
MHPVIAEEREWERVVGHVFRDASPRLVAVSRYVADSRVYSVDGALAKIRRKGVLRLPGVHTLEQEAEVRGALGLICHYEQWRGWEILTTSVAGPDDVTLADARSALTKAQLLLVLARVGRRLSSLHERGVAHCDLRLDNIVLHPDGGVDLMDFDRALVAGPLPAALLDWFGWGPRTTRAATPFWKLATHAFFPKSQGLTSRLKALLRGPPAIRLRSADSRAVALLADAWRTAQASPSNSPGHLLAYYAFSFQGEHFPGERPWYQRWEPLRTAIDWSDKRVLELGCNMGLLSAFARIHGAAEATAVDRDALILEAGRLVCVALDVDGVTFSQADLTSRSWEVRMPDADICIAMSVLHWLPQEAQQRLVRFLGRHDEVVYEGHQPLSVEVGRLRSAGFRQVDVLGQSERGRHLLHAHNHPLP